MSAVELARDLAADFATRDREVDRDGRFPHENIDALKAGGYLKLPVPKELGAFGADLETVCRAQSILAGD